MTSESRWLLWGACLLAAGVAVLLLAGILAPAALPAEAQRYFDPAYIARAKAFSRARQFLFLAGQALTVGLLWAAVTRGWDGSAAAWLARLAGPRPLLQTVLLGALVVVALTVVELPASWGRFVLDHRFGLSNQSLALWLADLGRSLAVGLVVAAVLLAGLFWLIQRWPAGWWAPAGLGFAMYLVLSTFLWPLWIDPLYHRFTPLADTGLAAEVRALAQRAGVPVDEVLVMDASRRTRRVNAYFTGMGSSRRIVLYDTLLAAYDRPQVLAVLAHELGHWRLQHIFRGVALGAVGGALVLWLAQRLLAGVGGRPGAPAQVVVLLLFLSLLAFATLPVQNWFSRSFERQADRFAVALTGDAPGYAALEERLARDNLADVAPHPLVVAILYSHPPVLERIHAALQKPR